MCNETIGLEVCTYIIVRGQVDGEDCSVAKLVKSVYGNKRQ